MNEKRYKKISKRLFIGAIALFALAFIDTLIANVFPQYQIQCGIAWMVIEALILVLLPTALITLIVLKRKLLKTMEQKQNG